MIEQQSSTERRTSALLIKYSNRGNPTECCDLQMISGVNPEGENKKQTKKKIFLRFDAIKAKITKVSKSNGFKVNIAMKKQEKMQIKMCRLNLFLCSFHHLQIQKNPWIDLNNSVFPDG